MRPRKKILLVGSNTDALSIQKYVLEINGYRVFETASCAEAIKIFADNHFELVMADLHMPEKSGVELIAQLKAICSDIPMVILCTNTPDRLVHGADALINKRTCSSQELLARIKILSARKRGPRKGIVGEPIQSS